MIISEFQTFLIVILDNVKHCLIILSCLSFLSCIGFAFLSNDSDLTSNEQEVFKKWSKRIGIIFCILLSLATIVPNTKQMLATLIIPKIVNNEQIQNLSADTIKAIGLLVNGDKNESNNHNTNR